MNPSWLAQIVSEAFEVFTVLDPSGKIIYLSQAVHERTPDNSMGMRPAQVIDPGDMPAWKEAWDACLETHKPRDLDGMHILGRIYKIRLVPLLEDGELVGVATINVDITAERDTKQALRVRDEQLRLALDASGMGQWSWDISIDQVTWDNAAKRIFGWDESRDDISYATFLEHVPEHDRERVVAHVTRAVETGVYRNLESRITRSDGSQGWVLVTGAVLQAPDGKATHLLGGIVDITQTKQDEARVHRAQKLEAIGQLAGGVAHDFNNLLIAISGNVQFARRSRGDEERETALREATAACQRAADLTRQLLAFARRQQIHRDVLDLGEMVKDTLQLLKRLLPSNLEVEFFASDEPLAIRGDRAQLEQVLINLCVNARDAMPAGGRLTIEISRIEPPAGMAPAKGFASLRVTDSGTGIEPEVLDSIFEPFFTTKEHGTGLGLASAYGTVNQHGGLLRVQSTLGAGSSFEAVLPLEQEGASRPSETSQEIVAGGAETILIAEDDPAVRSVIERMLSDAGYRVICAKDGDEAVELFTQHQDSVDLLVVDGVMPKRGGLQVVAEARRLRPSVGTLLSTGYVSDLTSGPVPPSLDGVLQKPYETAELLRLVREALDAAEQRRTQRSGSATSG